MVVFFLFTQLLLSVVLFFSQTIRCCMEGQECPTQQMAPQVPSSALVCPEIGCVSSVISPELYLPQPQLNVSGQVIMNVSSKSFVSDEMIGQQFSCDDKSRPYSPHVQWDAVENAQSYILIVEDPDAQGAHTPFIHWIVFNIPRTVTELKEGTQLLAIGGIEGKNSAEKIGYYPFCPPHGSHRYYFKVYALDKQLDLPTGAGKKEIEAAMQDHILGHGELMGRYSKAQK